MKHKAEASERWAARGKVNMREAYLVTHAARRNAAEGGAPYVEIVTTRYREGIRMSRSLRVRMSPETAIALAAELQAHGTKYAAAK